MSGYYEPIKFHGTKAEYEAEIEWRATMHCRQVCIFSKQCAVRTNATTKCKDVLRANIEHVPPPRWRAEHYGEYWCVSAMGKVFKAHEAHSPSDRERYAIGNYFRTREDAERAVPYVKVAFERAQEEAEGAGE